jgi:hypothetical protein
MTDLELFKYGFLLRCAEEGLTPDETAERVRQALELTKQADLGGIGQAIRTGTNAVVGLGGLGLAGSAAIGAGAGWLGAKMTEPDTNPEEAKTQELIETYRLFAQQARQAAQRRRSYRQTPAARRFVR